MYLPIHYLHKDGSGAYKTGLQFFKQDGTYLLTTSASFTVPGGLVLMIPNTVSGTMLPIGLNNLDDITTMKFSLKDGDIQSRLNESSDYLELTSKFPTTIGGAKTYAGLSVRNNAYYNSNPNYFYNISLTGMSTVALISSPNVNDDYTLSFAIQDNVTDGNVSLLNGVTNGWAKTLIELYTMDNPSDLLDGNIFRRFTWYVNPYFGANDGCLPCCSSRPHS